MSIALDSFAAAWRPRDTRTRCEWASDNVVVPNMARAPRFDVSAAPWQQEPIDLSQDNTVKEMWLMWPTGAGKSNVIDAIVPHCLAEDPGDILLAVQGNKEAKDYVSTRLLPAIEHVPELRTLLSISGRHAAQKGIIKFPHMVCYWGGVNEANAQAKSVLKVIIDEAWMAKHGLIKQFRARTHDRWNDLVIAMGQGGETHIIVDGKQVETEWESGWQRTDRREWMFLCPECGQLQRWSWKALKYERAETVGGELDETAIAESAHYRCPGALLETPACNARFDDLPHIRRGLANASRYVPQNARPLVVDGRKYIGFHCNALTLYYIPWAALAVEHAAAHRARKAGDEEPMKLLRQKRGAENHRKEEHVVMTVLTLGDYSLADYADGQNWDGEVMRCLNIDVQHGHYWATARAWKADGSSRRVYAGKVLTEQQLRDIQLRLGVQDCWVTIDSGEGRQTDRVYNLAARFGWHAFKGDKGTKYRHIRGGKTAWKYYSAPQSFMGSEGKRCRLIIFSTLEIKRILERLRNGPQEIGRENGEPIVTDVPRWELDRDIEDALQRHLFSEVERNEKFVVVGKRENHTWDTEVHGVVCAISANVLAYHPAEEKPEPTTYEA